MVKGNGGTFNIVIKSDKSTQNFLKRGEQAGARKPLKQEKTDKGTVLTYPSQMGKKSTSFIESEAAKKNRNVFIHGFKTMNKDMKNTVSNISKKFASDIAIKKYDIPVFDEKTLDVFNNLGLKPEMAYGVKSTTAHFKNITPEQKEALDFEKERGNEILRQQKLQKDLDKQSQTSYGKTSTNIGKLKDFLAKGIRENITELAPGFKKKYPTLVPQNNEQIVDFQKELARIERKQKKRVVASKEQKSEEQLEKIRSKNIAKMYDQQIKAKEEADKRVTKSLVDNIINRKKVESEQEKKLQSDQRDYWRNAKKERDRLVKEQSKRESSMENLRKANHKKQVTRYKTRSAFSRNLSTMSLSLNMSMLGIMFSFMSLFSIITGIFGSIFAAASNLTGAVSGGALAEAFLSPEALRMTAINPETGKEGAVGLKRQGMDVGSLVESYKKSLGVQGEMAYQMSQLSAALLNNPEFMAGVMSAIDELSNTFSDPEFVRSVVKSMKAIMDMLPDVLDSLLILLDLTTMFIPFLQTWLPLILASVILLPVLSLFNAVFGVVAMGFAVTNDLLAAILVSQEATRLASVAASGVSALGVPAAAAGGAGGGILASLGLGGAGAGLGTISLYGIALLATTIITTKIKNWISDSINDIVFETPIISVPFDMLEDITDGFINKAKEIVLNWIVGSDGSEEKRDILSSVLDYIGDWVDDLFSPSILLNDASISGFSGLHAQLITKIWDFAVEVLNNILTTGDPYSSFRAPPSLADRGYATGGYVSNTGLAMVHEGEYISNSSEPTSNGNVSQNVNITVYGDLDSKAADKVIDELVAQQRYSSWS